MADNNELNFFKKAASLSDTPPATEVEKKSEENTVAVEHLFSKESKKDVQKKDAGSRASQTDYKKDVFTPGAKTSNSDIKLLKKIASDSIQMLEKSGLGSYAKEIQRIISNKEKQKFTVAVVGEFSRGKSSFINALLERDILPVANMPTTAMLTRIRNTNRNEALRIYDATKKSKISLPLSEESWQNYVADDNGKDPEGVAFVGINSPWLKTGIELIDTPGAGDLEEKRAGLIEDALKSSDCAIITISALSALSMSEKLFIEERLIAKKTPFLMLIITKLDQVDKEQRNDVVRYVEEKLKLWNFDNINLFIPYTVEMPDETYSHIMGMDKIKNQINSWQTGSERKALAEQWTALKLKAVFRSVINYATEQKCISDEQDAEKKEKLIEQKKKLIDNANDTWDSICSQMTQREAECYQDFLKKVSDSKELLIEKLQYEVSHTSNVKKWWEEDFPYKMKIEMSNLANSIEVVVSRHITKDIAWFNTMLEKNFKTNVIFSMEDITDRAHYTNIQKDDSVSFKDISKSRNISRIGITALSMGAALVCMAVNIAPLIATMGFGTGGNILSESIFKNKTETQKKELKDVLQTRIPDIVDNATKHSEARIKNIYHDIIEEASKKQKSWIESQQSVIESASSEASSADFNTDNLIKVMKSFCAKIDSNLSC